MKDSVLIKSLVLLVGTALSQLIPIVFLPIISKLYPPSAFGEFAVFISLCSVLSVVSTGRYELAILKPNSNRYSVDLFLSSVLITLAFSFVVFFLGVLIHYCFNQNIPFRLSSIALYLLPFGILNFSLIQILSNYLSRLQDYIQLSILRILQGIIIAVFTIIFGKFSDSQGGLIFSVVLFSICLLAYTFFKLSNFWMRFRWVNILAVIRYYKDFPSQLMTTAIMDSMAIQVPILFLSTYFSAMQVGIFSMGSRIIYAPLSLIGASMSQPFFQEATYIINNRLDLSGLFKKVFGYLLILSIIILFTVQFFIDSVIVNYFSSDWHDSILVIKILSVAVFFRLIVSPMSILLVALDDYSLVKTWQFSYLLFTILLFFFLRNFDFKTVLWAYALHECVQYIVYFILIQKSEKKYSRNMNS